MLFTNNIKCYIILVYPIYNHNKGRNIYKSQAQRVIETVIDIHKNKELFFMPN